MTDPHPETGQADPGVSPTDTSALRARIEQLRADMEATATAMEWARVAETPEHFYRNGQVWATRKWAKELAALLTPTDTEL